MKENNKCKMRIAIYSRKSKFSDKGESVANQIELCKEYINLHYPSDEYDVEIVIYEDEGYSGGNFDRPHFKDFLLEEKVNPFDILICYRLDRISRNIADFSNMMNEISKLGTNFVSIKEQFDTKTPMGRAMMFIASVFAQLEREVIAERIRDNMIELAKTGRWLGGEAPTGYKSEQYEVVNVCERNADNTLQNKKRKAFKLAKVDEEKEVIHLIYNKFLQLKSLTQLELYTMKNNILTRNKKNFTTNSLRRMLTNPAYAKNDKDIFDYYNSKNITIYSGNEQEAFDGKHGLIAYNKLDGDKVRELEDWIIAVGLHEGYIDGKDWIAVQELLKKNADKTYRAAARKKNEAILSGILKCKCCGSPMRPRSSMRTSKDGTPQYYYVCKSKEKSRGFKCQSKNINGINADRKIVEELKNIFVPNAEVYEELKKMQFAKQYNYDNEIKSVERKIKKNENTIQSLVDKLVHIDVDLIGIINEEMKKLKNENERLNKELQELNLSNTNQNNRITKNIKSAKFILDIIDNCFDVFDSFDLKLKKDLIGMLVESAYGEGENIEINLLNTKMKNNETVFFYTPINKECKKINHMLPSDTRCEVSWMTKKYKPFPFIIT